MKDITINHPLLKFWILGTVPTDDIKTTSTIERIKIKIDTTLKDKLSGQHNRLHTHECEQMILDIHQQMLMLTKHHLSVSHFDIDDIVIIEKKYYFINDKKILNVKNSHITIKKLLEDSMFLPYELGNDTKTISLPLNIHINSYMYSLALLTLYCLFNTSFKTRDDALVILNQIPGVELYWLMSRCLEIDASERKLLYI
jgi:hypothetical protein